jgi:hypothetical protein
MKSRIALAVLLLTSIDFEIGELHEITYRTSSITSDQHRLR